MKNCYVTAAVTEAQKLVVAAALFLKPKNLYVATAVKQTQKLVVAGALY